MGNQGFVLTTQFGKFSMSDLQQTQNGSISDCLLLLLILFRYVCTCDLNTLLGNVSYEIFAVIFACDFEVVDDENGTLVMVFSDNYFLTWT